MTSTVYLGVGSNIDPRRHLPLGVSALDRLLGPLRCSATYSGPAIGFAGDPFWNLVVRVDTDLPVGELQRALREIEYAHGRPRNATRFSARALDIDILTHGATTGVIDGVTLPRGEILENAFVLRPLAELAPQALHPVLQTTYAELWEAYDEASQPLVAVEIDYPAL